MTDQKIRFKENSLLPAILLIVVFCLYSNCSTNKSTIHPANNSFAIQYTTSDHQKIHNSIDAINWTDANDFKFLKKLSNKKYINLKITFKQKNSRDFYFYSDRSLSQIRLLANFSPYWQTPPNNIFFNSYTIPLLIDTNEIIIEIKNNEMWPYSGNHIRLERIDDLQTNLFRIHLFRFILGAIFIIMGTILWGLIIARPKEAVAVISFELFLLLIGVFCISSSSLMHYLFWSIDFWPGLSLSSILLAPIPLFIYLAKTAKELPRVWIRSFYILAFLILLAFIPGMLSVYLYQTNRLINSISPVLMILSLVIIIALGIYLFLHEKPGNKVHGIGLILFGLLFSFDIVNNAFNLDIVQDYLSPYGTFLLIIAIFIILEARFSKASKGLEQSLKSLRKLNKSYNRFIPVEFFDFLDKKEITDVQLGNNIECEFTIMVTDIHHFTTLSEKMTPVENFDFVNSYFDRIVPSIKGNNGFIAKYMGDGIMALFPGSSHDAVKCALDIHNILYVYNNSRKARNREGINTGIGIHRGIARLGIIGSQSRMQGDIISDAANMAARIEGLTRIYGAHTVISDSAYEELNQNFPDNGYIFRPLDRVIMKGKKQSITIYELLPKNTDGSSNLKIETLSNYNLATRAYLKGDFTICADIMQEIIKINPDDLTVQRYIDNSIYYAINGTPIDWKGVTELNRKN